MLSSFSLIELKASAPSFDNKPVSIFTISDATPIDASLTKLSNETFGLELDLKQDVINELLDQNKDQLEMSIPVGVDDELILSLTRNEIFADGMLQISTSEGNNAIQTSGLFYAGHLVSDPSKKAAISVFNDQIVGFVTASNGLQLTIGKIKSNANNKHVIFAEENFGEAPSNECADVPFATSAQKIKALAASGVAKSTGPNNVVRVYFEVDYDTYLELGSVQACVDMTTGIFNAVYSIYQNIAVNLVITEVYVWSTPDNYDKTDTSWGQRLVDFRTTRTSFNGDVAHLIHKNSTNCFGGGIAYVGALCNGYGYGVSMLQCEATQPYPTYNFPVALVSHELGHNLGGLHTHECYWNGNDTAIDLCGGDLGCTDPSTVTAQNPGTIMSYCFFNTVDFTNPFHAQQIPVIQNYVYAASCLEMDSDGDGVYDSVDACPGFDDAIDTDNDTVPDGCDICAGFDDTIDTDNDSVPDSCDICLGFDDAIDTDNDNVPDGCDICAGFDDAIDTDNDSVPDGCDTCVGFDDTIDSDNDSIPDDCDVCAGFDDAIDTDNDNVPDGCDACAGFDDAIDTDNDSVPDGCDICVGFDDAIDADNDNVPDGCDVCAGFDDAIDTDNDSVPDGCDVCAGFDDAIDTDNDGVPDGCDICAGFDDSLDADTDSVPDGCDICAGFDDAQDNDGDGIPDGCDACPGFDDNNNMDGDGVPDDCDCSPNDPSVSNIDACGNCGGVGVGNYSFTATTPSGLFHTGSGSNSVTLTFPFVVTNVNFEIRSISSVTQGGQNVRYNEQVTVEYVDQNGVTQTHGVYVDVPSAMVAITDSVQSITVYLEDVFDDGFTNAMMEVHIFPVQACEVFLACGTPCSSSATVPTTPGIYVGEQSVVEGDWTYYCDCDGNLLLGLDKSSSSSILVVPSQVSLEVGTGATYYPSLTGFINNPFGAAFMNRKWEVDPQSQPTNGEEVGVKFYYADENYQALQDTLTNRNSSWTISSPTDIRFYKVTNIGLGNFPAIPTIMSDDLIILRNDTSSTTTFAAAMHPNAIDHYAEFKVTSFSGGGGGAGDETAGFLPVELVSFSGHEHNCDIELNWQTGIEIDNAIFVLQKSYNGQTYEPITTVEGRNNAFGLNSYTFTDKKNAFNGEIYYRLKQIDFDGSINYSKAISVQSNCMVPEFSLYPNPVLENVQVNVEMDIAQSAEIRLISIDGKQLVSFPVALESGMNNVGFAIEDKYPAGVYIIQIKIGNKLKSKRLVKSLK